MVGSPSPFPSRSLRHPGPGDPEMLDTPFRVPCSVAPLTVAACLCLFPALGWSTAPGLLCAHVGACGTDGQQHVLIGESASSTLQPHTSYPCTARAASSLLTYTVVCRQATCPVDRSHRSRRSPARYPIPPLFHVQLHDPPEGWGSGWPEARHQSSRHFTSLLAMLTDIRLPNAGLYPK